MEFVKLIPINRICPCCGNGNYMRIISGKNVGKLNVKCINCNSYYNYDELLKIDNSKPLNGADGRTMDDTISRAAAIAEIDEYLHGLDSCISEPDLKLDGYKNGLQVAIQELKELPAVDAAPVVHGRWIQADLDDDYVTCSCCKANNSKDRMAWTPEFAEILKYCPNCGARMDGEQRLAFADQSGAEYADNPTV